MALSRKPRAPALAASSKAAVSSKVVSSTTGRRRPRAASARMRPRPSSRGMRMSDSTRSGIWSTAHWPSHSSASAPSLALADDAQVILQAEQALEAFAHQLLVFDEEDLDRVAHAGRGGSGRGQAVRGQWSSMRKPGLVRTTCIWPPSSLMRSAMPVRPLPARPGSQRGAPRPSSSMLTATRSPSARRRTCTARHRHGGPSW